MAIVTHPDGYLQITEGHNWQDTSDNGILQRIFKGWNERRLVAGLPLYWYGKNPNASELLGGDAQFTEFENPLFVTNPTYTLEDARIYPGANLQNYKFWRKLQEVAVEKDGEQYSDGIVTEIQPLNRLLPKEYGFGGFIHYPNGDRNSNYSNLQVEVDEVGGEALSPDFWIPKSDADQKIYPDYSASRSYNLEEFYQTCSQNYTRSNSQTGYIEPGDYIGAHTINDLLRVYSRISHTFVAPYANYVNRSARTGDDDDRSSCQAAFNSAVSRLIQSTGSDITYSTVIRVDKVGFSFNYEGFRQFETASAFPRFENLSKTIVCWYSVRHITGGLAYDYVPVYSSTPQKTESAIQQIANDFTFNLTDLIGKNGQADIWDLLNANCSTLGSVAHVAAEAEFHVVHQYQFSDLAPYVPNAYNYSVNVTNIDLPQSLPIIG